MPSQLPASQGGNIVPVYTTQDINKWLGARTGDISSVTTAVLVIIAFVGLCFFIAGVLAYMKENREEAGQAGMGGGGGRRPSVTYILIGAGFGAADVIFLMLVNLIRS